MKKPAKVCIVERHGGSVVRLPPVSLGYSTLGLNLFRGGVQLFHRLATAPWLKYPT